MKKQKNFLDTLDETLYHLRRRLKRAKTPRDRLRILFPFLLTGLILLLIMILLLTGLGKLLSGGSVPAGSDHVETEPVTEEVSGKRFEEKTVTIGSTGCMLLHGPILYSCVDPTDQTKYDFSSIYKYITPYYSKPDYMVCEFEGSLAGPQAGYSGHPLFRSPDIMIENIRDSGVDLQLLATNHIYDGSTAGFHRTLDVYDEKGIAYTGARQELTDDQYYIADINGIKVGFLNYVYETPEEGIFLNGNPTYYDDGQLINTFEYENLEDFYLELANNIVDMRGDGAQFIIANLHWGTEYQLTQSEEQTRIAQRLCELGIDALIGGHPHCEQPIDVLTSASGAHKMFCIYSVGNALTNQRAELISQMQTGHTEDGVMVTLDLHQSSDGTVSISGIDLLPTWVCLTGGSSPQYYILPLDDVNSLEATTGLPDILEDAQASYARTMEELGPGLEKARDAFGISKTEQETEQETEREF